MVPAKQEQNIVVQIAKNFDVPDFDLSKVRKLVKTVCRRFKVSKATVSVAIVDDAEIRRLNKQFLGRKGTTDCLSFNLSDDTTKGPGRMGSEPGRLFEILVNGEMAVKEAKLRGHCGQAELALYVIHGLLHNLGFDDSAKDKAKKMHDTEDEILQQLGYGLVYNKGTEVL